MVNNEKRNFKGVWIPKEIYLNQELNWTEKILLIEIDSLDNKKGCYASNEYFANFLSVSKNYISQCISKLKDKGFIYQKEFNGRKRVLKSNLKYSVQSKAEFDNIQRQGLNKVKGRVKQKSNHNNINNNTSINNTSINNKESEKNNSPSLSINEKKILKIFKNIDKYPFEYEKDIHHIRELKTDYPKVNLLEEAKKWKTYKLDKPLKENSNARLQFRNWIKNASKWNTSVDNNSQSEKELREQRIKKQMKRAEKYG